jgi:hypothetical protein
VRQEIDAAVARVRQRPSTQARRVAAAEVRRIKREHIAPLQRAKKQEREAAKRCKAAARERGRRVIARQREEAKRARERLRERLRVAKQRAQELSRTLRAAASEECERKAAAIVLELSEWAEGVQEIRRAASGVVPSARHRKAAVRSQEQAGMWWDQAREVLDEELGAEIAEWIIGQARVPTGHPIARDLAKYRGRKMSSGNPGQPRVPWSGQQAAGQWLSEGWPIIAPDAYEAVTRRAEREEEREAEARIREQAEADEAEILEALALVRDARAEEAAELEAYAEHLRDEGWSEADIRKALAA